MNPEKLPFADGVRQLTPPLPVDAHNSFCNPFSSALCRFQTGLLQAYRQRMYFRISTADSDIDGALMRVIWINFKVG